MIKQKNTALTSKEIKERAERLRWRLDNDETRRANKERQYTPWFVHHNPKWYGDGALQHRIRMVFNGKGTPLDTNLLLELEAIADKHLDK